jgi:putative flippase GtrA
MSSTSNTNDKVPFMESFFKSQASSFVATMVDFAVLITLTELISVYYVYSTAIGAACGAVVSFFLGRNWAFRKKDGKLTHQASRYILTSVASLLLNTYGVFLLTETLGLQYIVSKLIISFLVGVLFNFFMFRYFVYR